MCFSIQVFMAANLHPINIYNRSFLFDVLMAMKTLLIVL